MNDPVFQVIRSRSPIDKNKQVFINKTGLIKYSDAWKTDLDYPELRAVKALDGMAKEANGVGLFEGAIFPGDRVVIKPNFVRNWHPDGKDIFSVITHPSIIRAAVDLAYQAMKGEGRIIIADAPNGDTDFGN